VSANVFASFARHEQSFLFFFFVICKALKKRLLMLLERFNPAGTNERIILTSWFVSGWIQSKKRFQWTSWFTERGLKMSDHRLLSFYLGIEVHLRAAPTTSLWLLLRTQQGDGTTTQLQRLWPLQLALTQARGHLFSSTLLLSFCCHCWLFLFIFDYLFYLKY
jgi:hypothetical protein